MMRTSEEQLPAGDSEATGTWSHSLKFIKLLLKYGGPQLLRHLRLDHVMPVPNEAAQLASAEELAADLEAMGPAYVKLGQLLSTRADLLPATYIKALSRLHDRVKPVPTEEIKKVIEAELNIKIPDLFTEFDDVPVGAASLAQVHRGVLRTGRLVVVKVLRPLAQESVKTDLDVFRHVFQWIYDHTDFGKRIRILDFFKEFEKSLLRELNYKTEAQNLLRLAADLKEFERIVVPKPLEALTTAHVLTMDYIEGDKIDQMGPLGRMEVEGDALVGELLKAYLKQVFVTGFFHADPHPGNIFLIGQTKLALIDVGLVGYLSPHLRRKLLQMLPPIYNMEAEELVDLAVDLGETNAQFEPKQLTREYTDILEKSQAQNLQQLSVAEILFDITRVSMECGLFLPSDISLVGRTLLHLDTVGRLLAPEFNVNKVIREEVFHLAEAQAKQDVSPKAILKTLFEGREFLISLPRRAHQLLEALINRNFQVKVEVLPGDVFLIHLQKIANRITTGIILAALIMGAAMLMRVETSFKILGYPGFAMICFAGALTGGLALLFTIWRGDNPEKERLKRKQF